MKSSYLLIIVVIVTAALSLGWFFDEKKPISLVSPLQVPDNIDYYLSNINYKSMNLQGSLHYHLQSPLLQHYIQEDASKIQQPVIQFNGDKSTWFIQSESALLKHENDQFELRQQVELKRNSQQPMLVKTDLMYLKPRQNLVQIPMHMTVTTTNVNLQAASAELDMNQNTYKFKRVKAIYQQDKA